MKIGVYSLDECNINPEVYGIPFKRSKMAVNDLIELGFYVQNNMDQFYPVFKDEEAIKRTDYYEEVKCNIRTFEKGVLSKASWSSKTYQKEGYLFVSDYYDDRIKQIHDVKIWINKIKDWFNDETKLIEPMVLNFIRYLVKLEVPLDKEEMEKYCTNLFLQLKGVNPDWLITIWVSGVWIEGELSFDNVKIRKPVEADFSYVRPVTAVTNISTNYETCSAIIELKLKNCVSTEVDTFKDKLLSALSLYGTGNIYIHKTFRDSNHVYGLSSNSLISNSNYFTGYSYEIKANESDKIKAFFKLIFPFFETRPSSLEVGDRTALYIAFDRYKEAHKVQTSFESKVSKYISSLEALLLNDSNRSELSNRLSQRAAMLIGLEQPSKSIEVYRKIKKAYSIRSKYVHGSLVDASEKKGLKDLTFELADINRRLIVMIIKLTETKKKDSVISKIDNLMMLFGDKRDKVIQELKDFL